MVSKRTQELIQADLEHHVHPFWTVGQKVDFVFEKAHGIYLVDTEGKEYIDLSSQLVCSNLGHHCQEIIDAVKEALDKIDYITSFFRQTHVYAVELSQKLAKITPGGLRYFYYTCGGSEAVDTALKIARAYWYLKGQAGKYKIMSLYNCYHGLAGYSNYVTGLGGGMFHNPFGPPPTGFLRVPSYYDYRSMFGDVPDSAMLSVDFMEKIIQEEGAASIAAFIAEPILGSSGSIEPPPQWWSRVMEICKKYDILLITDEVMTGFARTGKMFASEHWDIKPDIMTMAKGITNATIPFGGVAFSDEVYSAFEGNMFPHGFTYAAHPIGCAASIATIDYYLKNNVAENAAKVGKHIKERLETEFLPLPCVGLVEGRGVFQAIELVNDKESRAPVRQKVIAEFLQKLFDNGIWTRIQGPAGNRLQICPPCTITMEEADKALDILRPIITELKPQ
ncbi:MAG: aspartate aminotransferase family protein [Deltaproteobacteria bacterium]|nr:aspartate aminotransferase family protein [Deltaproteobacteria bacterium]